jgi:alkanesulfonate monooxygenase SsuD/methylene tetrahydromethanopterin reductase-like flavin-dependent oxidoreductase (luciferase family)
MRLALFGLHRDSNATDPDQLVRRARLAEEAGFESLWVGDHILLPPDVDVAPRLETVTALTYLAAVTSRVRLASGVFVLPQRQPVLLAKQLASVDVLSGGRLTVGIGVGYIEAELTALGASLADRAARTDEYLAALRTLWAAEQADSTASSCRSPATNDRSRCSPAARRSWSAACRSPPTDGLYNKETAGTAGN